MVVVPVRFASFPLAFKAKAQAGRGQLLNETMFYRVYKVDIESLKNDK